MNNICLYFNIPSIYRETIYKTIDETFNCHWFFDSSELNVKQFDTKCLHTVTFLHTISFKGFYWTFGLLKLLSKNYDEYLMIGATRNVTLYIFLFLKLIFFRNKKVYLWTHGYYGKEKWYELYLFKRPLMRMADKILLYGNYARNLMIKDGFDENKLYTIHNSLAYNNQLCIRRNLIKSNLYEAHFKNKYQTLIFIGRLTAVKKLNYILEAIHILQNRGELFNVVFIGEGENRINLENLALRLGIDDRVWFYGECFDEETNANLIYNADLCISPGNVGLTAIHSLMFGCPVITHDDFTLQMPEFEAIKQSVTGALFTNNDIESLSNAISSWFLNHKDREITRKNCYQEIDEHWNPRYQIMILKELFSENSIIV